MSGVPDCLVDCVVMHEMALSGVGLGIPELDGFVHGTTEDHSLVDVVPFATLNLSLMPF